MLKLIKYLKKSAMSIVIIVVLLAMQAVCDLSLPTYTSNIVNVGIQQGGIEDAVPNIIRKSEMDRINLFLKADEKETVMKHYKLLSKDKLSSEDYKDYADKYSAIKKENLYELKSIDKEAREEVNGIIAKAMLVVSTFESNGSESKQIKEQMFNQMQAQMAKVQAGAAQAGAQQSGAQGPKSRILTPGAVNGAKGDQKQTRGAIPTKAEDLDVFAMFADMPKESLDKVNKEIYKKIDKMPETIITQAAVKFVKTENNRVGIDTDRAQTNYILSAGAKMLGVALLSVIAAVTVGFLASRVAATVGKNLRGEVFKKVTRFSTSEINKFSTASLITRSTNDIQQIQMLMVLLLRIVVFAPIMGIGALLKVIHTNTSMSWIIGVAVLAMMVTIGVMFSLVMPKFKLMQKLVDKLNLVTREIVTGIPVIRAFSNEDYEENRFDGANRDLTSTNLFVNRMMSGMMPVMMLIMNLITVLIVWKGAYGVDSGAMQVGDMMAFIQYTMQIIMAFLMISMVSIMLPRAMVSAERIDEVLTTEESISDPKEAKKSSDDMKGYVEFKDVSFKFPDSEEPVLEGITFTAKPGQTTAFIGSTGSGKTTLVNLIPRFYDVTGGEILVDGVDVRELSQHDLRDKLGYVPQKGVLFSGTIDSNLRYGRKNITEEEMKEAAEIAQATEFIDTKPDKYSSEISQGGTNVSGGQKQRLSIARAIAKNPEIYIFDDSFSALDLKTDAMLRKALSEKVSDSTMLIVAQRISTIMSAEQIVVLDDGKIAGIGTHKELLKDCEVYKQIALSQLTKEELEHE
ncbi:MAG: ABC transporter ATP-binding protein [Clostridioides sp.]|jgi:ATP-binding cassette subfamily B protein|nr:ABC transporter ATP-binding protein [Clostridioides sp.]